MKLIYYLLIGLQLVSCNNSNLSKPKDNMDDTMFVWKKVLDSGPWPKSYNFQMFSIKDTLWVFHNAGNWYSTNGINWQKSLLPNSIFNLAFLDYVQFNNAVYGLGHFEGNIEQFNLTSAISKTTNFKEWEIISRQSNLPKRFFYHPFVFNNKIWLIGGQDKQTKYADIWNSDDGINWIKQRDNASFGKRSNSQIVQLNGKLFLLDNDVWSSANGLDWNLETTEIVKGENVFGYSAIVFDNKIWLIGCNRNGNFSSEVLMSNNGKTWIAQHAPFSARGGVAAAVFNSNIYVTGGKYGGTPNNPEFIYSNDLWSLTNTKHN